MKKPKTAKPVSRKLNSGDLTSFGLGVIAGMLMADFLPGSFASKRPVSKTRNPGASVVPITSAVKKGRKRGVPK